MAGVTDRPFRDLCRSFGATWAISEMVTSDQSLWHTAKSRSRLPSADEPGPRWIQLAGAEPARLADAARRNVELGADIIDINMGCPAKKVCNRAAGSALLRDEALVAEILEAVVAAVDVPVTLKTRLGWSRDEMNGIRIAQLAEAIGISLITMHGRTRACRFKEAVDYNAIGQVKNAVSIPVIANGDIDTPEKAREVLALTGCDGVMIGRAARGRPWLPASIDRVLNGRQALTEPSQEQLADLLSTHISRLHDLYGAYTGVRVARKHVGWTLDHYDLQALKSLFNRAELPAEQFQLIDQLRETEETEIAA
ncbi:MAG: tRNA dihydrouridine synthase DusB [Pseudomonadales bacterium]|nr:tRNA dihydrouridine synthase DusB [Pseudomonadales bacterium]